MTVKKGSWVRVYDVLLTANERVGNLPEDTRKVPLEMWTKGILQDDAKLGDRVKIKTITGREIEAELIEVDPYYDHNYGKYVPQLLPIGEQLRNLLAGGAVDEL
ncbi:MAG: 2-amino-4-oxopentanoate thiolase subunit OrtA [Alkaliphilus sp.]